MEGGSLCLHTQFHVLTRCRCLVIRVSVIVDLLPPPKSPKKLNSIAAYVAISRARRLDDIAILREFPIDVLFSPPPPIELVREMARLERVARATVVPGI